MNEIVSKIQEDFKQSYKDRDVVRKNALSLLKNEINSFEKFNGAPISVEDTYKIIRKQIAELNETRSYLENDESNKVSLDEISQGLAHYESYLPKQLSEAEVIESIKQISSQIQEDNKGKKIGLVMKELKALHGASIDPKSCGRIVKDYV